MLTILGLAHPSCANRVDSIVLKAYALKVYSYLKVGLKQSKWCFILTPAAGLQVYKYHNWTLFRTFRKKRSLGVDNKESG